jgi:hypothetical protein
MQFNSHSDVRGFTHLQQYPDWLQYPCQLTSMRQGTLHRHAGLGWLTAECGITLQAGVLWKRLYMLAVKKASCSAQLQLTLLVLA